MVGAEATHVRILPRPPRFLGVAQLQRPSISRDGSFPRILSKSARPNGVVGDNPKENGGEIKEPQNIRRPFRAVRNKPHVDESPPAERILPRPRRARILAPNPIDIS